MFQTLNHKFGTTVTRLIKKENLTREEARLAFVSILNNEVTDMHQGAFLASLTAKGESKQEVAGAWEAIYNLDTTKVTLKKMGSKPWIIAALAWIPLKPLISALLHPLLLLQEVFPWRATEPGQSLQYAGLLIWLKPLVWMWNARQNL